MRLKSEDLGCGLNLIVKGVACFVEKLGMGKFMGRKGAWLEADVRI